MINRETLVPYGIAGLVLVLVAGLVGLDVVASLPSAPATPAPAPAPVPQVAPAPAPPVPPAPNKPEKELQNLVLFTEVPFRGTNVTTGRRFSRPQDERPSEQWCYILRRVRGRAADQRVTLGTRQGSSPVRWEVQGAQAAADLGFSLAELEAARGKCRFTGDEE
jgi:hypothetical protein